MKETIALIDFVYRTLKDFPLSVLIDADNFLLNVTLGWGCKIPLHSYCCLALEIFCTEIKILNLRIG